MVGDEIELGLGDVAEDDFRAAARQRGERHHHADGAGAGDDGDVAGTDGAFEGGVDADRQRFDHGALGKADVIGQLIGQRRRVNHLRRQAAVGLFAVFWCRTLRAWYPIAIRQFQA